MGAFDAGFPVVGNGGIARFPRNGRDGNGGSSLHPLAQLRAGEAVEGLQYLQIVAGGRYQGGGQVF